MMSVGGHKQHSCHGASKITGNNVTALLLFIKLNCSNIKVRLAHKSDHPSTHLSNLI